MRPSSVGRRNLEMIEASLVENLLGKLRIRVVHVLEEGRARSGVPWVRLLGYCLLDPKQGPNIYLLSVWRSYR
jgi:hypothetical protein